MAIVRANEILKERYEILRLSKNFKDIMGNIPKDNQWTMLLHGIAGSGKSTFALLLAKELSNFGNVLYGNFEEAVGATLQAKLKHTKLENNRKIHFIDPNTEQEFWKLLSTKHYKYAIVDSLSHIAGAEKQVNIFYEKIKDNTATSFIFICHALKSKDGKTETNYRGAAALSHIVDINQRVVDGVVWNDKNRLLGRDTNKSKGFSIFRKNIWSAVK
jgi:predicted ATP-dependent serine protease